jgi:ribosomal-protein-alanine N-acetyltransferase
MEKQINFIQIEKDNTSHFEMASELWIPYHKEIDEHIGTYLQEEEIIKDLKKRISIQGRRKDMHFEIACVNEEPFGIAMFAIDLGTVYGLLEKGYGTILEFYIHPEFRRKGLGTLFSKHIEATLYADGARKMYLCPDPVTGKPFWKSKGYTDSGKIDPDDKRPIYIKGLSVPIDFTNCQMISLTRNAALEIRQWEYKNPYDAYNFKGHPNSYLMDESKWGTEQFCLMDNEMILGHVACQFDGDDLWVGWSMAPQLCGKGNGCEFIKRCVKELRRITGHTGRILLRVAAWNKRAIFAYQKAGFLM